MADFTIPTDEQYTDYSDTFEFTLAAAETLKLQGSDDFKDAIDLTVPATFSGDFVVTVRAVWSKP